MSGQQQKPGLRGLWPLVSALAAGLAAGAVGMGAAGRLRRRRNAQAPAERPMTPADHEALEPGRGRAAATPSDLTRKGWTDVFWRLGLSYFGDRIGFIAGGVTFFVALSLFPTLAVFVTLYGLVADPAQAWDHLAFLSQGLPQDVAAFLGGEMRRLAESRSQTLGVTLAGMVVLSLWSANGVVKALFYGLNIAYHEVERRHLLRYNLLCLGFTLSGLAFAFLSTALVVGLPLVTALAGGEGAWSRLAPFRWPVLFVIHVTALTLVYRWGPCRTPARWRWLRPGAIFAALLSVALSLLFSWYLHTFVRTAAYGPLAAMMGFLLWTWLSVQIVLLGARLNAEVEHQTAVDTTIGPRRPMGERGAVMADTLGARRGTPAALTFTLRHAEALSDRVLRRRGGRRD